MFIGMYLFNVFHPAKVLPDEVSSIHHVTSTKEGYGRLAEAAGGGSKHQQTVDVRESIYGFPYSSWSYHEEQLVTLPHPTAH